MTNRSTFMHLLLRLSPFLVAYAVLLALSLPEATDRTSLRRHRNSTARTIPATLDGYSATAQLSWRF